MIWTHAGPAVLAAFLASLVEFVEALTVILAVGSVRGWRPALAGAMAGVLVLAGLVAALAPVLSQIPLAVLQLVIGVLLLLFGVRWLRKAVLRSAAVIPEREAAAFASKSAALKDVAARKSSWDRVALATSFNIVMLEGLEVVFIVIAVGATGGMLIPASLGAFAALTVVILVGLALRRPLAQVPENKLKFAVGVLLTAFGTFWVGEGIGVTWPNGDWALAALVAGYLLTALAAVRLCRRPAFKGVTS